jgi:hypothetical protein
MLHRASSARCLDFELVGLSRNGCGCGRKRTQNHVNDLESRMEEKKNKLGALQQQAQQSRAAQAGKQ